MYPQLTNPDSPSVSLTIDELRWLEASALLEIEASLPTGSIIADGELHAASSPHIHGGEDSYFKSIPQKSRLSPIPSLGTPTKRARLSPPSTFLPTPPLTPPRNGSPSPSSSSPVLPGAVHSEWIYRRPKSPSHVRPRQPLHSRARPQTSYHAHVRANSDSSAQYLPASLYDEAQHPASVTPFWATILRPRSRARRSVPQLKAIPSQSQINFISAPRSLDHAPSVSSTIDSCDNTQALRPPSMTSTLSSASAATAYSRPVTPTSPHASRRRYHGQTQASLSSSCPPSKSILTRTSSISTKHSTSTAASKSVKFAEAPTVHYANPRYWDLPPSPLDVYNTTMGINIDDMDIDDDALGRRDWSAPVEEVREIMTISIPEVHRPTKLKRRGSASKKSSSIGEGSFPNISRPFALGAFPLVSSESITTQITPSLTSQQRSKAKPAEYFKGSTSLRTAPSLESFRSTKSLGEKSVLSLRSVKSNSSTRGFRSWLGRLTGAGATAAS